MSAENILKKQTGVILGKNNWMKSVVGFLCVLTSFAIPFMLIYFSAAFLDDGFLKNNTVDFSEMNPLNAGICIASAVLSLIVFVMLLPVYTGYIRFIAGCRDSQSGDIEDIFYYFQKGKYLDTVQLNMIILIRKAVWFLVFSLPAVIMLYLASRFYEQRILWSICALWVGIFGFIGYLMVSRLYIMTQYLYVSDFNYKRERDIIKASSYMVRKNYGRIISLYLSYIIWGIFCFFVIPVVFVYPYFKHCALLSYSYIYDMENNNPDSIYYASNKPLGEFSVSTPVSLKKDVSENASEDISSEISSEAEPQE